MKLEKTNIQGFSKNKKQNVLINTNAEKLKQVQETKKRYQKQLATEVALKVLTKRYEDLEARVRLLEMKGLA